MEPKTSDEIKSQYPEILYETVMALPSAEFRGQITDFAKNGTSKLYPIQSRVIYDSSLELARLPISQAGLQELLRYALGATTNYGGLTPEGTEPTADLLREMFEKYKLSGAPLTIVLAHGEVDARRNLMIRVDRSITYPFEQYRQVIEERDEGRRREKGLESAPSVILLASCTTEDPNFSIPPSPKSIVYYRKGVVGILHGTGEFTKSK